MNHEHAKAQEQVDLKSLFDVQSFMSVRYIEQRFLSKTRP